MVIYIIKMVYISIGEESNFINDENYGVILEIPFYNKIVKGKVIINKYGEEVSYVDNSYYYKNIMLSNVYFELYAKDDIYENDSSIAARTKGVGILWWILLLLIVRVEV